MLLLQDLVGLEQRGLDVAVDERVLVEASLIARLHYIQALLQHRHAQTAAVSAVGPLQRNALKPATCAGSASKCGYSLSYRS